MQQHPTNNLCQIIAARAQRDENLLTARAIMLAREATSAQLDAACEILTRHGDHIDYARAEMIRARIRRDLRHATALSDRSQGGAA
jgi:hypothetical protein